MAKIDSFLKPIFEKWEICCWMTVEYGFIEISNLTMQERCVMVS